MKTHVAKPAETDGRWYLVDAEDQILGRLATRVAHVIRGKHRPDFTPHMDHGDHVVIVNAQKIKVTGRKLEQRTFTRYSGYPSGIRTFRLGEIISQHPEEALAHAVRGMLPKGRLGRKLIRKLRVYAGASHPHGAQKPEPMKF